ncbi:MAG: porin, partial [Haloferula sp.]
AHHSIHDMKSHHATRLGLPVLCAAGVLGNLHAGDLPSTVIEEPAESNPGNFCDWLSSKPGTLYKNSDNPWFQEFQVFGRFQWQAAYLSAEDVNGYNFSDTYTEVRRFRLGAKAKFLKYFTVKANVNMVDDASNNLAPWPGGRKLGWGYEEFDEALVSFDIKKAFDLGFVDDLDITYGRHKFVLSHEARESSKKLLTVERSAIANKVYGSYRPTGVTLNGGKGKWDGTLGLFSTDALTRRAGGNIEFLGGWNDGLAYYASLAYAPCDEWEFRWDFVYNDADQNQNEDSLFRYSWATSLSADYDAGEWGVIVNAIYGDNGDSANGIRRPERQGDFWGLVVMPYYWIVEDKLQGVVRYQYAGSEEDRGIRINSRYGRRDHGLGVAAETYSGRGNEHHSIYAGLNYLICGHNLKVQAGLEYEWLNVPGAGLEGDYSALTSWFGFRSYF